jgi:aspartyl-tRNA(Asn)/glutamyl-tRNA(Gln) amidotransferase subunit A
MSKLTHLSIADARDKLQSRAISAVELTEAHLLAIEKADSLNAFVTKTPELALERAREADQAIGRGEGGLLAGIPLAIKDLFCTEGVRTTASSKILGNFVPTYESTVSGNLRKAGAVMLGKTSLDEFAMGSSNMTSAFGPVINPWKRQSDPSLSLVPGGSSGGSATAVAARLALGATGTDTGGSIRQPASFCGIVGLKPTYGRCSRWGVVAFASSLDQAGPMTRTVKDAALMLQVMAGYDPKDSTSANIAVPNFAAAMTGDIRGMKIGIPKEYRPDGLSDEIAKLWDDGIAMLKANGAIPVEISLPHTKYALPTYYIVAPAECSSNLARYDGVRYGSRVEGKTLDELYAKTRAAGFGTEVRRRILIGTYVLSAGYYNAYYTKAQKVRALIAEDFRNAYEKVDVILTPTAPSAAFALGAGDDDPVTMWLNDVFTVPASLAGLPGISLPTGQSSDGLPLGLQLLGRPFDEETLLRAAGVLETAAEFKATPTGVEI